jgi:hypothetical protein
LLKSKRPSQRLTMCALLSFFLTPIKTPRHSSRPSASLISGLFSLDLLE